MALQLQASVMRPFQFGPELDVRDMRNLMRVRDRVKLDRDRNPEDAAEIMSHLTAAIEVFLKDQRVASAGQPRLRRGTAKGNR